MKNSSASDKALFLITYNMIPAFIGTRKIPWQRITGVCFYANSFDEALCIVDESDLLVYAMGGIRCTPTGFAGIAYQSPTYYLYNHET